MRSWHSNRERPFYPRSLQTCDIINVPNYDELAYISDVLNLGDKCVVFPFGLNQDRYQNFQQAIKSYEERLSNKQIVFIGSWGPRKGSRDWLQIITQVKKQVPNAKFLFLGTGVSLQKVLQDLNLPACDWINIIPQYNSEELPMLLSGATVGAFPSYIEGFGFAVLEKLASGLPTIAYDVPGPREILKLLDGSLLTPVGDVSVFAERLISLLNMDLAPYSELSNQCIGVANKFSWDIIAKQTLKVYYNDLEKISVLHKCGMN
ncbi:MAG: glycosyltransferase family 4 protein [Dolichospermum sp.]